MICSCRLHHAKICQRRWADAMASGVHIHYQQLPSVHVLQATSDYCLYSLTLNTDALNKGFAWRVISGNHRLHLPSIL
jgi:hypothetical protein